MNGFHTVYKETFNALVFLNFLSSLINNIKKIESKNLTTQMYDLYVDFALKLSNKTFVMSQRNPKKMSPQYYIFSLTTKHCRSLPLSVFTSDPPYKARIPTISLKALSDQV